MLISIAINGDGDPVLPARPISLRLQQLKEEVKQHCKLKEAEAEVKEARTRQLEYLSTGAEAWRKLLKGGVLDLVSQVRDVVLMSVYLDLGNPGGSGFWNGGYMSKGREMES